MLRKLFVGLIAVTFFTCSAEELNAQLPMFGAEIIIEPGQTDAAIDSWFKRLNENGMTLCRIRMFEEYMHKTDGTWDFTLFDKAFHAAEKYNVKVFATLFPSSGTASIGGFKFPSSEAHETQIAEYIFHIVNHYKGFKSLYGWVLMNEPGTGGFLPDTEYTRLKFNEWKQKQAEPAYKSQGYPLLKNFDKQKFLVYYNSWYLNWIAKEVAKYDTGHEIHVNNHQIFDNIAEYDFPAWRKFLTSLGASAHPSWHFGYFDRSEYTVALSANCSIIRSGAGNLPFLITELQGGNNTYSGINPLCPTDKEIIQWLWTSIASGAQGIVFWSLNSRSIGEEAGEWALVDFQGKASDRLQAINKVESCINSNKNLFSNIQPMHSNIHILYNRPSLWIEKEVQYGTTNDYEGRQPGGIIKSIMAYYKLFCEHGIVPDINEFSEFDWTKSDYTNTSIMLANIISLPSYEWENIRNFVKRGGRLFVEGITGFYDENMLSLFSTDFPLKDVFGGSLSDVNCVPGNFKMEVSGTILPGHLWRAHIRNTDGKIIGSDNNYTTAIRNEFGKGYVVWVPSLLGMGARRTSNFQPLSDLVMQQLQPSVSICFEKQEEGLFMQTFKGSGGYLSVVINKNKEKKTVKINSPYKSNLLFVNDQAKLNHNELTIDPEETVLIKWN